jgi:hypothetical protein
MTYRYETYTFTTTSTSTVRRFRTESAAITTRRPRLSGRLRHPSPYRRAGHRLAHRHLPDGGGGVTALVKVAARRLTAGCHIRLEGAEWAPCGARDAAGYWVEGRVTELVRGARWVELTAQCRGRDGFSEQRHFVVRAAARVAARA